MMKKKAAPVKPTEKFPGVYLTEIPRNIQFGKSQVGPATNLRPAGAHKQANKPAPEPSDWE